MKKLLFIVLFFTSTCIGQTIFFDGWRINQGNTPGGPNLNLQGYGINANGADVGDPTITVSSNGGGTGAGTLYNAIFTALGGTGSATSHKKIVFSLSVGNKTISVSPANRLEVTALSYVTIDGGSDTITITNTTEDGLSLDGSGCHHVIVKNLHFVNCGLSDAVSGSDGANAVNGAHDIAFMNNSFYGNSDGNLDIATNCTNVTAQYNIIGYHTSPADDGAGGMLITATEISVHHNLFDVKSPEEGERCPLIHGNYSDAYADVRNNIVYNYGRSNATGSGYGTACLYGVSGAGGYARANIVNNYYYTPSTTADQDGVWVNGDGGSVTPGEAYSAGNVSGNGFNFNTGTYTNHAEWTVSPPYSIGVESTCDAVHNVLAHVGPALKNAVDNALIAEITSLGSCSIQRKLPLSLKLYEGLAYKNNNGKNNPYYSVTMEGVANINSRRKRASKNKTNV